MSIDLAYYPSRDRGKSVLSQVIALGQFDGFHVGHLGLLQQVKRLAHIHSLQSSVLLFSPLPKVYFKRLQAQDRLQTTWEQQEFVLGDGLDGVFVLEFNNCIQKLSPVVFVEEILLAKCCPSYVVVGEDFRFGYKRSGDTTLLRELLKQRGVELVVLSDIKLGKRRVSSTWCREALIAKDFILINQLMGRPWSFRVDVQYCAEKNAGLSVLEPKLWPRLEGHVVLIELNDGQVVEGRATISGIDSEQPSLVLHQFKYEGRAKVIVQS